MTRSTLHLKCDGQQLLSAASELKFYSDGLPINPLDCLVQFLDLLSALRARDLDNFLVEANRHLKTSVAVTIGIDVQRDGAHISKPVYHRFNISKNSLYGIN